MQMSEQACSICSRPFNEDCVVPIHGTPHQVEALKARLKARKEAAKAKKGRKRKLAALSSLGDSPPAIEAVAAAGL